MASRTAVYVLSALVYGALAVGCSGTVVGQRESEANWSGVCEGAAGVCVVGRSSSGTMDASSRIETPDSGPSIGSSPDGGSKRVPPSPSPSDGSDASDGTSRRPPDAGAKGVRADAGIDATPIDAGRFDVVRASTSGTIAYFPASGGGATDPVGADVQVTFFQTLPDNRDVRRGIIEFATSELPAERAIAHATLQVRSNVPGESSLLPTIYYRVLVSHFPGDLVVTMDDYTHPSVDVAEFEAPGERIDPDQGGQPIFRLDVTSAIQGYAARREDVAFRFRLADEDITAAQSGGGSLAGTDSEDGPRLIIDWVDPP